MTTLETLGTNKLKMFKKLIVKTYMFAISYRCCWCTVFGVMLETDCSLPLQHHFLVSAENIASAFREAPSGVTQKLHFYLK